MGGGLGTTIGRAIAERNPTEQWKTLRRNGLDVAVVPRPHGWAAAVSYSF